jgi:hypothetical protein
MRVPGVGNLQRKPGRPATSAGGLFFTEKSTLAMSHVG